MNTIFSAVDNDGDTIRVTIEDEDGFGFTVKQDDTPCGMFLDDDQVDMLIDALADFRGRVVPDGEVNYELRHQALKDARSLLQNVFGPGNPEKMVMVAEYLIGGIAGMQAQAVAK